MDEIIELEGRIAAALGRIRRQVDAIPAPSGGGAGGADTVVALRARLDEERTVNAQLEERVRALKARQDSKLAGLEAQVEADRDRLSGLDAELQRLQAVNAALRAVAAEMRRALQAEVAEPELINRAAVAELEAVTAARTADLAEMEAILAELVPWIGEAR